MRLQSSKSENTAQFQRPWGRAVCNARRTCLRGPLDKSLSRLVGKQMTWCAFTLTRREKRMLKAHLKLLDVNTFGGNVFGCWLNRTSVKSWKDSSTSRTHSRAFACKGDPARKLAIWPSGLPKTGNWTFYIRLSSSLKG